MIGDKIKYYCKKDGRKEKFLADAMGITPGYLSELYTKKSLQTELLERIALVLRIPISAFFAEINDANLILNEPETIYNPPEPAAGELEALRELVRTQRELIEQLKTAGDAAQTKKPTPQVPQGRKPVTH